MSMSKYQKSRFIRKVAIISTVCGLLGGLCAYGGVSYLDNNFSFMPNSTISSKSSLGGRAKSSYTSNVQNQAERAFKAVQPTVVSVINMQKQNNNPLIHMFGEGATTNNTEQTTSEGSGVIYKIHDGSAYIVTNNHVISDSNKIKIVLSNGRTITGHVLGTIKSDDLAVIKVNSAGIHKVATLGNSDNIQAGETSLAIGSPLGASYASTLTKGIISDKSRQITKVRNGQKVGTTNVIQTDAAINPGNSGGALINLNGQVIGINSAKVATTSEGTNVQGMGFAIPSNEVIHDINQIVSENK